MMFGENNWKEIKGAVVKDIDPYKWEDTKKYTDRLADAKKTGLCLVMRSKNK